MVGRTSYKNKSKIYSTIFSNTVSFPRKSTSKTHRCTRLTQYTSQNVSDHRSPILLLPQFLALTLYTLTLVSTGTSFIRNAYRTRSKTDNTISRSVFTNGDKSRKFYNGQTHASRSIVHVPRKFPPSIFSETKPPANKLRPTFSTYFYTKNRPCRLAPRFNSRLFNHDG